MTALPARRARAPASSAGRALAPRWRCRSRWQWRAPHPPEKVRRFPWRRPRGWDPDPRGRSRGFRAAHRAFALRCASFRRVRHCVSMQEGTRWPPKRDRSGARGCSGAARPGQGLSCGQGFALLLCCTSAEDNLWEGAMADNEGVRRRDVLKGIGLTGAAAGLATTNVAVVAKGRPSLRRSRMSMLLLQHAMPIQPTPTVSSLLPRPRSSWRSSIR